jgi:hypothetical protein
VKIEEAEAGVAEIILTATPSAPAPAPAPKAKLNRKIKMHDKLDIALSIKRKKQAKAVLLLLCLLKGCQDCGKDLQLDLTALLYLGDAVDVADIAGILVVGHVEGRQVARCLDVATSCFGSDTYHHSPSTCHPDGALVLLEEVAAMLTQLLPLRLMPEGLEIVVGLLVCEEEEQAQEFTVDAAEVRDMHACKKATCRLW